MLEYVSQNLWLVWTVVVFICLILELSSGDFYVICFAIGALASSVAAVADAPLWMQVALWALCSMLSIWLVRPHLVSALHRGGDDRRSNTEALAGRVGEVTQHIPMGGYGRVKLDGDDWKAEAPGTKEDIPVGTKVRIIGNESIILSVELAQG